MLRIQEVKTGKAIKWAGGLWRDGGYVQPLGDLLNKACSVLLLPACAHPRADTCPWRDETVPRCNWNMSLVRTVYAHCWFSWDVFHSKAFLIRQCVDWLWHKLVILLYSNDSSQTSCADPDDIVSHLEWEGIVNYFAFTVIYFLLFFSVPLHPLRCFPSSFSFASYPVMVVFLLDFSP